MTEAVTTMTAHARFLACMRHQAVDRPPLFEWGPWDTTIGRWMAQTGLSRAEVLAWMDDCDPQVETGVDFSMQPPFADRLIAEDETSITRVDRMGQVYRVFKEESDTSMPEFIDFPVKSMRDWREVKARFDPTPPARYPADWAQRLVTWRQEQPVLKCYGFVENYYGGPSLFGFVRMLMGPERALYAFYDEPELVHDMMETATEFAITVLQRALCEAPITFVQFWEDMCYKNGPLISPSLMKEFMVPRYRRITEVIRGAGVDIIFVDSDGDVRELIPLWLESGINGVFPMEQASGNDIAAYQRQYGADLLMMGGIDKRVLTQGHEAIDRELQAKIPLAINGGYLPTLDHAIPPDVAYEDFLYYWRRKKEMLGIE
ncbi:MAG: uroporphyrinogen decarboxylase family protein [Armatimonadota bacterium]